MSELARGEAGSGISASRHHSEAVHSLDGRWLVAAAIAARLVAAAVLVLGPWTNSAEELAGWDVERFQEIADAEGRPWVDHAVEYPPGSVAIIEAVARTDVVSTHRQLVLLSLAMDLAVAGVVAAVGGRRAGGTYLVLGLPLVPMGLLRLDVWSVALAVLAAVALIQRKPKTFAVLATVAALVKAWPVLLVAPAAALGRWRALGWTVATMATSGLLWVAWAGWTLDPITQVLTLRGAGGWHVESVPGSITALLTDNEPELRLDAFRIGSREPLLVATGRVLAAIAVGGLALAAARTRRPVLGTGAATEAAGRSELSTVGAIMVGSLSALIVTAPLLSPQFLLWLTPWAALSEQRPRGAAGTRRPSAVVLLVGLATASTGLTLALYGPPDLAEPTAAVLLLARDAVLVAIVVAAFDALRRSGRAEDALGHCRSGPGPAGADAEIDQVSDEPRRLTD